MQAALCPNQMKGKRTVKRLLSCLLVLALAAALAPCVLAENVLVTPDKLNEAIMSASDGDTIYLSEGNFSTYATAGNGKYYGKNLTFVGLGEKTVWQIGAKAPNPDYFGTEYNGDYSFDGRSTEKEETITFKGITFYVGSKDFLGFIGIDRLVMENCTVTGQVTYGGTKTATYKNVVFNAIEDATEGWKYNFFSFDGDEVTFDGCTFNGNGKFLNVYSHSEKSDVTNTVNFKDCTVHSTKGNKQPLNIKNSDSTTGEYTVTWIVNISGKNSFTADTADDCKPVDSTTCSRWFSVQKKGDGRDNLVTVNIDDVPVWKDGKMVSHAIDTANDQYTDGYKDNAFTISNETEWKLSSDGSHYTRNSTRVCDYCGYKEEGEEVGYKLSYDLNGGTGADGVSYDDEIISANRAVKVKAAPTLSGTDFVCWNTAQDGSGTNYAADASIKMTANVTLYAQWGQNSSASGFAFPVGDEHIAYVSGYPDGTVRPEANVTRAESAAMLYRLMPRGYFASGAQTPADVSVNDWYYSIVSQMIGSGYLTGYADGSFRGDNNVTRAEFVTMLVRLSGVYGGSCNFTDVSSDHWAYDAIRTAAANGWIAGYEDGSFRPDRAITRAEAMTIINRAFDRGVDETSWLGDYIGWPDNHRDAWYYYEVIEATNGHYYTGSRPSEDWVG